MSTTPDTDQLDRDAIRRFLIRAVQSSDGIPTGTTYDLLRDVVDSLAVEDGETTPYDARTASASPYINVSDADARSILDTVQAELHTNDECSDVHTLADLAADVVRVLTRHYLPDEAGDDAPDAPAMPPSIEVVGYRDPDAATAIHVFVDGKPAEFSEHIVDPGASGTSDEWRAGQHESANLYSPPAAALIREYADGAEF